MDQSRNINKSALLKQLKRLRYGSSTQRYQRQVKAVERSLKKFNDICWDQQINLENENLSQTNVDQNASVQNRQSYYEGLWD